MQNKLQQKIKWLFLLPVLFLLLLGLVLILVDRNRILQVLSEADWDHIPPALIFVAVSNCIYSISYAVLAKMIGIRTNQLELGKTFFVTNAMNRLLGGGGAAGFSLRYIMLRPYGVGLSVVLNSSFIHFLLSTLIMFGMLPLMILYILVTLPVTPGLTVVLIFLAFIGASLGVGVFFVLFDERFRGNAGRLAIWLGKKVIRRDFAPFVNEFTQRATSMVTAIKQDWNGFRIVMLLLLGEWSANVIVLSFCLNAFGPGLPLPGSATLYVLGTMVGGLTGIPGGIGVQEAVMTSLAVLQGVNFAQAALAAILYRIVQTFLPFLLSFGFYPGLLIANLVKLRPTEVTK